jgi:hypothetical protein
MTERKGERRETGQGIYEVDGVYHCSECHCEVPVKQMCPICKKEIDWDRIFFEAHRH